MEPMQITVVSTRVVAGQVRAVVQADSPPSARINLELTFPLTILTDIWAAARDEALKYPDPT